MKNFLAFLLGFTIMFAMLIPFANAYQHMYDSDDKCITFLWSSHGHPYDETSTAGKEYIIHPETGYVTWVSNIYGGYSGTLSGYKWTGASWARVNIITSIKYNHKTFQNLSDQFNMTIDGTVTFDGRDYPCTDPPPQCAEEQPEDAQWMTVPNYRDPPPWCFDNCEYVQSTVNQSGQPIGVTYATGQSSDCIDPSTCDDYTNAWVYSSGENCDSGDYNYDSPADPPSCDQLENECYQRCGGLVEFYSCDPPGCRCQVPPPPAPPGPPVPPSPPDPGTPNDPYNPDPDGDPYTGDFGEGPPGEGDSTCVTCDPETETCDDPNVVYCDEDGNTPCDPETENCGGDDPYDGPDSGTPVQDDPDNPGNELPVTLKDPSAGTCPPGKICIGDGICQPGEDPTSADCVSGTYIIDRWNQFISETNVPFSGLTESNLNIGSGSAIQTVDLGGLGGEVTFDWSEFDNVWLIIKTVLLIVFSWIGIRIIALKR